MRASHFRSQYISLIYDEKENFMFQRKRFRLVIAIILTLLLTVALASLAAAQDVGNGNPPKPGTPTPEPTATRALPGTVGGDNDQTGDPAKPTRTLPDSTGGNGDQTGGDMMKPAPWPPSNLIVRHAATPVQLSAAGGGMNTYFIGPDGAAHSGPYIDSFSNLAQKHPSGGAVTLYSGTNPGSGKPVTIYYLPAEMKVRISTYYPDTQYDVNKPYILTVDANHSVTHDRW